MRDAHRCIETDSARWGSFYYNEARKVGSWAQWKTRASLNLWTLAPSSLIRQPEIDGDLGLDFDGLTVQQIRSVLPLTYCFDRRPSWHGVAVEHLNAGDRSVFVNGSQQVHCTLFAQLQSHRRIRWRYFLDQQALRNTLRNPD